MMEHTTNEDLKLRRLDDTSHAKTYKYDLADMLSSVDPVNRHPEYETDPAQGKEEW